MATLVRHIMTAEPKTLSTSMSAADAAGMMANYDVGSIPVLGDDGELAGIVTDRDIVVRVVANRDDPTKVSLGDIATQITVEVTPDTEIADANQMMADHKIRRLPVTKDGALVGIVSLGDVALALASKRTLGETLEDVSTSPSTTSRNEGPDQGTPTRVMDNREPGGTRTQGGDR
jgi:CBS domain-containing protein